VQARGYKRRAHNLRASSMSIVCMSIVFLPVSLMHVHWCPSALESAEPEAHLGILGAGVVSAEGGIKSSIVHVRGKISHKQREV